jgi:hypothetical protein
MTFRSAMVMNAILSKRGSTRARHSSKNVIIDVKLKTDFLGGRHKYSNQTKELKTELRIKGPLYTAS